MQKHFITRITTLQARENIKDFGQFKLRLFNVLQGLIFEEIELMLFKTCLDKQIL